jgi:hypothetical protein
MVPRDRAGNNEPIGIGLPQIFLTQGWITTAARISAFCRMSSAESRGILNNNIMLALKNDVIGGSSKQIQRSRE